ncbi:hypothetical protein [Trinickia fusca]|uniref:Uncharacterized protein n=1 Tax=Trinickia fusca TaxID=2419777 RepID=A0A494X2N2_9BURK|nr:hypothetical protein [Trinickia fusca]RKP44622.1 hypothetical protein D7S89_22395 [Trinickia fusca]
MDILDIATQAGLQVLLDARIGNETYHSVCGSLTALQRFADAVSAAARAESLEHARSDQPRNAPPHHRSPMRTARARRVARHRADAARAGSVDRGTRAST